MKAKKFIRSVCVLCVVVAVSSCTRTAVGLPVPDRVLQIEAILTNYGGCSYLVDYEPGERIVHLVISGYLASGTDVGCEDFGEMIWRIARIDKRIQIRVIGKFVPSRENPITYEGAKRLVGSEQ